MCSGGQGTKTSTRCARKSTPTFKSGAEVFDSPEDQPWTNGTGAPSWRWGPYRPFLPYLLCLLCRTGMGWEQRGRERERFWNWVSHDASRSKLATTQAKGIGRAPRRSDGGFGRPRYRSAPLGADRGAHEISVGGEGRKTVVAPFKVLTMVDVFCLNRTTEK